MQEDCGKGFYDVGGGKDGFSGDVDLILLTHTHNDHINDFLALAKACLREGKHPDVVLGNEAYSVMPKVLEDSIGIERMQGHLSGPEYSEMKNLLYALFPRAFPDKKNRPPEKKKGKGREPRTKKEREREAQRQAARDAAYAEALENYEARESLERDGAPLRFITRGDRESFYFGPNREHKLQVFSAERGREHLPGTRHYKISFFHGTGREITVSSLFDFYAEKTESRARDRAKHPFLERLSDADALLMEGTTAYQTTGILTRAERERALELEIERAVREGKKYIVFPGFAQDRAPKILTHLKNSIARLDLGDADYRVHFLGPLSKDLVYAHASPYRHHIPEIRAADRDMRWSYRPQADKDPADDKIHFVVATSGFCLSDTPSERHLRAAIGDEFGAVILTSSYAPDSSPLRPLLDRLNAGDEELAKYLRVVSQTGHPGPGGYDVAARLAAPKREGGSLLLVHAGPEAIPAFTGARRHDGYAVYGPANPQTGYSEQVSGKRTAGRSLYVGSESESLVICAGGKSFQAESKRVPGIIRELALGRG